MIFGHLSLAGAWTPADVLAKGYDVAFANFWDRRSIFYSEVFVVEVSASVSASLGTSVSANWTYEIYSTITNRQACYIINSECLNNDSYLSPGLKEFMAPLPTNYRDQSVLYLWSNGFIKRYGFHVNVVRALALHGLRRSSSRA